QAPPAEHRLPTPARPPAQLTALQDRRSFLSACTGFPGRRAAMLNQKRESIIDAAPAGAGAHERALPDGRRVQLGGSPWRSGLTDHGRSALRLAGIARPQWRAVWRLQPGTVWASGRSERANARSASK